MPHSQRLPIAILFLTTVVLSLIPFFKVGFTTSDDVQYFITAQQNWQYWMMDHHYFALGQGRFFYLITKYFYYVPYLADNFFVTKTIQYITLLSCYLLFAYIVYRILRSQALGLLTLLMLVLNTCINKSGNFIAVTAYPFFFTFSFLVFLLGVLQLVNYYQRGGRWRPLWASLLFFAAALFYENYVIFILLVVLYVAVRHLRRDGWSQMWGEKNFWRETTPIALSAIIYVIIYVTYRNWVAANFPETVFYDGTQLTGNSGFSLEKFFRIVTRCTLVALPGQNYFLSKDIVASNALLTTDFHNTPLFLLTHASAVVIANAVIQSLLFVLLIRQVRLNSVSYRKLLTVAACALLFAFSANILIAVTLKYQEWSTWLWGYVTSFYSFFGIALTLAVIVTLTLKLVYNGIWNKILQGFWSLTIFFIAVITGFSNESLSREWQRSQARFVAIDEMGKEGAFDILPDEALLYTEGLHTTSPTAYFICKGTDDIEDYITLRSGRKFQYAIDSAQMAAKRGQYAADKIYTIDAKEIGKTSSILVNITSSGKELYSKRCCPFECRPQKR